MSIAVSGASGFIGQHVVAELARRGLEPVLMRHTDHPLPAELAAHRSCVIDIAEPPADTFERLGRPRTLIHLAWGGLPNYRSLAHFENELPQHYRFLQQLVQAGLGKLVATGTCFEYGMQSGALDETLPVRPENPYGYAKDALRRQLQFLQATQPFELSWARLFYLWGDGQAAGSIYPQLCRAAEVGAEQFDMSAGEQLRDYLPVAEVARRIVALALDAPGAGVVNVCSGHPISVRRLVEQWIAESGWSIRPNPGRYPYPDYEPLAFWGDGRKFARLLESR